MQPGFLVFILPRQSELARDGGVLCCGRWGDDAGSAEGLVARRPDHPARLVGGLHRCAQVVVVVVGNRVLPVAVLRFDEQHAGGERIAGFGAVLGGDLRGGVAAHTAVGVQRHRLAALGDQACVAVEVEASVGLRQRLARFVAQLQFPQAPVHRVVAVLGDELFVALWA